MSKTDKIPDGDEAAAAAAGAEPTAEDLELIDPALEDESKTDKELFDEIGEDEDAAAAGAATAAASGTDTIEEQLEAGRAAKPAAEPEPTAEEQAAAAETKLWDGASEGAVAAFDAANVKIKDLEQKDRSHRGRFSTMQQQLNDVTRQLQTAADKDKAAADEGTGDGSAVEGVLGSEDWKAFEKEYPEISAPFRQAVEALQSENAATGTKVDAIGAKSADAAADAVDAQITLLDEKHVDWRDVAEDQDFNDWVQDQPKATRDAAARNAQNIVDAGEVAEMMGHFKAFRSEQAEPPDGPDADGEKPEDKDTVTSLDAKRQRQRKAARGARPKGAPVATGIPDGDDEEAIWDALDKKEAREAAQA